MNDNQIPNPPPKDELIFWILRRPVKDKPLEKMGLEYQAVAKMIKTAAKDAGIQKKVTPHLFRHSAITQWIREGRPETVLKSIMWGNVETGMLRTYSHISNLDIENAVKARHGIPIENKEELEGKTFDTLQCRFCGATNVPTNRFCAQCGHPLEGKVPAAQVDLKEISPIALALAGMIEREMKQTGQMEKKSSKTGNILKELLKTTKKSRGFKW